MSLQVKRVFPISESCQFYAGSIPVMRTNETEDRDMDEDTENKCPSSFDCGNAAKEPSTCPFAEEINDDSESLCLCCDDCTQECAWDI